MQANKYILLWFEAPLQSWGFDSKFDRRDSLDFPTKSGVIGLLCCAMGAKGEQKDFLADMSVLKQTVLSYCYNKIEEPMLVDYHMVGSGYDEKDPWQNMMIPKKSDGTSASKPGGTKRTYRYYLQDKIFAVIIEVSDKNEKVVTDSLINPVYDIFLGRKCCVPTDFIFKGVFANEQEAIDEAARLAKDKNIKEIFRVVDGKKENEEVFVLNDVPLQFGEVKKYRDRFVTKIDAAS